MYVCIHFQKIVCFFLQEKAYGMQINLAAEITSQQIQRKVSGSYIHYTSAVNSPFIVSEPQPLACNVCSSTQLLRCIKHIQRPKKCYRTLVETKYVNEQP
ncbi:UNVERIFIED_CONTAM: hypothetical protein K2H54_066387 [Gekko kuhli]